ncbi:MAG TPA: hypothetical protein VIK95_00670 [Egibacteraceae bacterium]
MEHLRARLAALDDDVSTHPAVLDDVHRHIVQALDDLARSGQVDGRDG